MTAAFGAFCLILLATPPQEADAAPLVDRLGSPDPATRDRAAEQIKTMGRDALPALEAAIQADDPTRRERASGLWEAIQRDALTKPTLIRLDGPARSRAETLDEIARQSGILLKGLRDDRNRGLAGPLPAPTPFWEALRGLGIGSFSHHSLVRSQFPELNLDDRPGPAHVSISGPFRFALTGLHLHHDRRLIGGPWPRIDRSGQRRDLPASATAGATTSFFGDLEVMVEPRMWFTQEGPARVVEAFDDLGQSLVPDPAVAATRMNDGYPFTFHAGFGATQAAAEFRLRVPEEVGRSARIRGVVPLMLHVRRPEPALLVPLADAAGKTFRADGFEFTINQVSESPTSTSVRTTVRWIHDAGPPDEAARQAIATRLYTWGMLQVQLLDADGKILSDGAGGGGGWESHDWNIATHFVGGATHLRVDSMLRVRVDAPFDFQGVPLP